MTPAKFSLLLLCAVLALSPAVAHAVTFRSVVDGKTGAAVAGARVISGLEETVTGPDGRFVTGASDTLVVLAPGYLPVRTTTGSGGAIRLRPFTPKALYLTSRGIGDAGLREAAMTLIAKGKANAMVIDVKDDFGNVIYPSRSAVAKAVGARSLTTIPDLAIFAKSMHERGIYIIARIVSFKDDRLATGRPELAVTSGGGLYRDREGLAWADPFRRAAWDYNIEIAREAAQAGFDEIQFDYARFPDSPVTLHFAQSADQMARVAAISGFLSAARRAVAPLGAFTGADFFGYVCWNNTDTGIGQQLADIAGAVDYLSPMLYPSGFHAGIPGFPDPISNTYQIIRLSLERARGRLNVPPIRFRPWLQAFRDYAFDRRMFDSAMIDQQIRASEDFGTNGWMLWNARNRYDMLDEVGVPVAANGCPAAVDGKAD